GAGRALASARVTPVNRLGGPQGLPATTDSSGRFALLLPPAPVEYGLRVGDAPDGGAVFGGGPIPAFADSALGFATATSGTVVTDVDVGPLPAPATLSGTVLGLDG